MNAIKKSQLVAASVCLFVHCCLIPMSASADTTPNNLESATVESTRSIASQLLNSLGQKLKTALSTDGPLAAVSVCKEAAPSIAHSLSAEHVCKLRGLAQESETKKWVSRMCGKKKR